MKRVIDRLLLVGIVALLSMSLFDNEFHHSKKKLQ